MDCLQHTAFREFFETSPQPMWIFDPESLCFLAVNGAVCERYGYSADEFLAMTLREVRAPEEIPHMEAALADMLRTGRTELPTVARHFTKSGRSITVEALVSIIQFDGQPAGIAILHDISREQELTARLRRSERDLLNAQMVAKIGSWSYDFESNRFWLSDEYYRVLGHTPGSFEPTWENCLAAVHPDDREKVVSSRTTDPNGPDPVELEVRVVRPDGQVRSVRSLTHATFEVDGTPIRLDGTIEDISERKHAEETHVRLSAIIESSADAVIGKALDGTITSWNGAAERLYGYKASEAIGREISFFTPPERRQVHYDVFEAVRNGKRVADFETLRTHKDGHRIEISLTSSPIALPDGRIVGVANIERDITARKEAERTLNAKVAQLSALRDIDAAITETFNLGTVLKVVVRQAIATTDISAACVYLYDKYLRTPILSASVAEGGRPLAESELRTGQRMAKTAIHDRKRVTSAPSLAAFVGQAYAMSTGLHGCDARPLMTKGEVIGALTVHYEQGIRRPVEQSHFLDALAGQAAIAVESATLFDDLQRSRADLEDAYDQTLEGWARTLDLRDHETEGHSRRVTELTMKLAIAARVPQEQLTHVRRGALLHDIGKVGVPDHILLKAGPLTEEEWMIMRRHPTYARDLIAPIEFLRPAIDIPYSHHERWDGQGYPQGLKGQQIPLSARLFAVADVWDALRSSRPYREAWTRERTRAHILAGSGKHFDPRVVEIFLALLDEDKSIQ